MGGRRAHYALAQVGHAAFSTAIPDYDFLYRQVLYGFRLDPGHVDQLFDEEEPAVREGSCAHAATRDL